MSPKYVLITSAACEVRNVDLFCFPFSLKELVEEIKMETDGFPFQRRLCIDGHIKELGLTVGQIRITCSFAIVGKEDNNRCLNENYKNTFI